MPSDTTDFELVRTQPEYDKNNPPTRMSEAIRMAVVDVEVQEQNGIEYNWFDCCACTISPICRRIGEDPNEWNSSRLAEPWQSILSALSEISYPNEPNALLGAYYEWPKGFSQKPEFDFKITSPNKNIGKFCADMRALADRLESEGS